MNTNISIECYRAVFKLSARLVLLKTDAFLKLSIQCLSNDYIMKKKIISTRKPFHELENEIEINDRQVNAVLSYFIKRKKSRTFSL